VGETAVGGIGYFMDAGAVGAAEIGGAGGVIVALAIITATALNPRRSVAAEAVEAGVDGAEVVVVTDWVEVVVGALDGLFVGGQWEPCCFGQFGREWVCGWRVEGGIGACGEEKEENCAERPVRSIA
jgi:hypothetical protein